MFRGFLRKILKLFLSEDGDVRQILDLFFNLCIFFDESTRRRGGGGGGGGLNIMLHILLQSLDIALAILIDCSFARRKL